MNRRRFAVGLVIAALYVIVAQVSFHRGLVPVRPIYDGTQSVAPYRWVNPPTDLKHTNTPPSSAAGTVGFSLLRTNGYNLNTDDGQGSLIVPPGGFVPLAGQTGVKVVIKPLDPAKVAPPPAGYDYDGNAYSFTATYIPSGKPAAIPKAVCSLSNANECATVVLRYAFSATKLYVLGGQTWSEVKSQNVRGALQLYGINDALGTFVAVDPHTPGGPKPKSQTGNIIAFVVGLAAILLGTFVARLRARSKRRLREAARGKKGSKAPQSKPSKPKRPKKPAKKQDEEKPWWRD